VSCRDIVLRAMKDFRQAPPSLYRQGGLELGKLILDDMDEDECECNEGLADDEGL
jgi:hypothetical protein